MAKIKKKKKKKRKRKKIYFQVKSVSFPGKQKLIFFFFVNLFILCQADEMKQRGRMAILVTNIASIVLFALMVFASIESK